MEAEQDNFVDNYAYYVSDKLEDMNLEFAHRQLRVYDMKKDNPNSVHLLNSVKRSIDIAERMGAGLDEIERARRALEERRRDYVERFGGR